MTQSCMTCELDTTSKATIQSSFTASKELLNAIEKASSYIAPVWPLSTSIACNPLLGLEKISFWQAINQLDGFDQLFYENQEIKTYLKKVNEPLIKWLKAFMDEDLAFFKMPNKSGGFFKSWLDLISLDKTIIQNKSDNEKLKFIPQEPLEAIEYGLNYLNVPIEMYESYLSFILNALPGFCGHIKWYNEWYNQNHKKPSITLLDVLAVRIIITKFLVEKHSLSFFVAIKRAQEKLNTTSNKLIENLEKNYQQSLINQFLMAPKSNLLNKSTPKGQLVFCIDVRSEPLRRQLEKKGHWETFGFAGFFGLPIHILDENLSSFDSCPALLKAKHLINTKKLPSTTKEKITITSQKLFKDLKFNFGTSFVLAESLGIFCGIWMATKTFFPKTAKKIKDFFTANPMDLLIHKIDDLNDISLDSQVEIAFNNLTAMGLIKDFAPLVVICGHKSHTTNNSFASTLDCGACGANRGGINAKLFAKILNNKKIHPALKTKGIYIPHDTIFIAAEHNTTTNEIIFIYDPDIDLSSCQSLKKLKQDIKDLKKGDEYLKNKIKTLDWSETRPEMGLSRNAAMIIGPRSLTSEIDLDGRAFLHSYDPLLDKDGHILQQILSGPLIVAEWINMQYFFSTYNNKLFGSGNKLSHNIVGGFGVMQGNLSDLMHGLSLQSVFLNDTQSHHDPLRLSVFIYASPNITKEIFSNNDKLNELLTNEWVHIFTIDPINLEIFQLNKEFNLLKINYKSIESI